MEKQLGNRNFRLDPAASFDNPEAVKQAAEHGLGVAFVSRSAVETGLKAGTLAALNVRGVRIRRGLKIIYRKGKHLGPAAAAFIEPARKSGR